jgi:hypothetical protein
MVPPDRIAVQKQVERGVESVLANALMSRAHVKLSAIENSNSLTRLTRDILASEGSCGGEDSGSR